MPHVNRSPALTAVNVPSGGVASPTTSEPQQVSVWSVRIAQTWSLPVLTAVNMPSGAYVAGWLSSL